MQRPTRFEHNRYLGDRRTQVVYDVDELDVNRDHAKIRGIVGSASEAQQIADGLKQNACFSDVKITKVSQVVNGTRLAGSPIVAVQSKPSVVVPPKRMMSAVL